MRLREIVTGTLTFVIGGWVAFAALPSLQSAAQMLYYYNPSTRNYEPYTQNRNSASLYSQNYHSDYYYLYDPVTGRPYPNYYAQTQFGNSANEQMTQRQHESLCRSLQSYCRSQISTNERAVERVARYGIQVQLDEPPTCELAEEICSSSFSESFNQQFPRAPTGTSLFNQPNTVFTQNPQVVQTGNCGCDQEPTGVYCGRDGRNYANKCEAFCAGTRVVYTGACGFYSQFRGYRIQ